MKKSALNLHNTLLWLSLFTILCWAISGITHPLMAWFGPQAVKMYPPQLQLSAENVLSIDAIIANESLDNAVITKLVPTADGPMLQVTNTSLERHYFSLENQRAVEDYDEQQAKWLAAYYTGRNQDEIKSVTKIDTFSHEYPRVNRLLPVYRVDVGQADSVSVYVYTETNVLASISNGTKRQLQNVFQVLHTWSWLDATGHARVIIIALLMLTLLTMALSGLTLVMLLPRRKIANQDRRLHRYLAYILWLPLLGWSASGFYHLLQAQYVEPVSGIRLASTNSLDDWQQKNVALAQWQESFLKSIENKSLNAISLVKNEQQAFYRLSVNTQDQSEEVKRVERFRGKPSETNVIYIDSETGLVSDYTDQQHAEYLFQQLNGQLTDVSDIKKITRFGPDYDFRNKRLPVWQLNLNDDQQSRLFIDPASNILVDQNRQIDRYESMSFSILHKWTLLSLVTGRQWRDVLIIITLAACLLLSFLGLRTYIAKKQARYNA